MLERAQGLAPLWQILALALISLAAEFGADAIVFRTPWYGEHIEPESFAGSYEAILRDERARPLNGAHRVLVLGDSSIAEGFSAALANRLAPQDGQWFFSSAGAPGATPRAWYYLLWDLDSQADRYNVIVLPVTDYLDADGLEAPDTDLEADREIDLNRLIVRLRLSDAFTFPFTYLDGDKKVRAFRGSLFKGLTYSPDFQTFVRDPKARLSKVATFREHARDWRDEYTGRQGSLSGVEYNPDSNRFTFSTSTDAGTRKALLDRYHPEALAVRGYRRAYRKRWLGGIADLYTNTRATIIFFRMPNRPFPLREKISPEGPTFLDGMRRRANIAVLDEDAFTDLQRPELFFDPYHFNSTGRSLFTASLTRAVVEAVNAAIKHGS